MSQGLNNDMAVSKSRRIVKNLRWWMLVLFLLGVTVNYITRNSLGIIAPELKTSLGITTEQYSWIVGAFQLAYTIFQPLCGWLIDVIGLKLGFMICATLWAIACIAHAGAGSWLHLAILRFFMGGAEAAATPANAKTLGEWFPKSERPIAAGWAASASPSAPCWRRRLSTSHTPRSAGRAHLCSPARWRCCGSCCGGRSIITRKNTLTSAKLSWR
jgi:ACS family hexuronate transporter-like MFS transporter